MNFITRLSWAIAFAAATAVHAEPDPAPLTLAEAQRLALAQQPLIEAQRLALRAARENAVAAAQLPDPALTGGVTDLPAAGPDRFTTREPDTQLMIGVKQVFPGGRERELRGERGAAEADRMAAELDEQRRMAQRETAVAWIGAWRALRAQRILNQAATEAQRQRDAADIAYRAGRAPQSELLASRVAVELLADQLDGLAQDEWHARNELRRWIGDAAERPLPAELPEWPAPDEAVLATRLETHPHVAVQQAAVAVARADVGLAQADYVPDWSVELGYGYRPEFDDFASVKFEIGLPLFTAQRQDRLVAARTAELERAGDLRDDWLRQHRAEIRLNAADWHRLQARFARYDNAIRPQAQQRLDAALAAYGAGSGALAAVIEARRSLLDIHMQRLELQADAARHQAQLQYFAPTEAQP